MSRVRQPGEFAASGPVITVHLLRHGKVHNPDGILYGTLPGFGLAASGRAMAQGVADDLASSGQAQRIRYLAASSLQRAQQTAEPLAQLTGLPITTDDRLIEAANAFAGAKFTASRLANPANWPRLLNPARPSWGEPYLNIARRMLGALQSAVAAIDAGASDPSEVDGAVAVLVSHQLPIWTARRFLSGQRLWHNPAKRQCGLASLTTVTLTGGVVTGISYSEPVSGIAAVDDPVQPK